MVSGGIDSAGRAVRDACVVEADTGRVRVVCPMRYARHGHTTTALHDGRVLAVGGVAAPTHTKFDYSTAPPPEVWDHATDTWSAPSELATLTRYQHCAFMVGREVLVVGGVEGGKSRATRGSALLLNIETMTLRAAPDLHITRWHAKALMLDGAPAVIGGNEPSALGAGTRYRDDGEFLYESEWRPIPSVGVAKGPGDAAVWDGKLVWVDAWTSTTRASTHILDSGRWMSGPAPTYPRSQFSLVPVPGCGLLLLGGSREIKVVEVLSKDAKAWLSLGETKTYRVGNSATLMGAQLIVLAGGSEARDVVEVLRVENDRDQ